MEKKSKMTERRILNAAQERFARFGYSKATMDEIAGDVQMGKASLYYYYPTKEKLFQAVIESEQNEFIKEIETIISKPISASKKLIDYVDKRFYYFEKFLNLGTLHLHSMMDNHSIHQNYFKEFNQKELRLLSSIIEDGIKSKEFRHNLTKDLPMVILRAQQGFRFFYLRRNIHTTGDKALLKKLHLDLKTLIEILIEGIKN
jgi:TetR/AcrR family transcriptional regulator